AGRIEEVPHGMAEFMIERSVELRTANKDLRLLGIVVYRHPVTYDARILDNALSTEIVHLMIECIVMQNISLPGVSADLARIIENLIPSRIKCGHESIVGIIKPF